MSKYSHRGNSLGNTRSKYPTLDDIQEESHVCEVCDSNLTKEEYAFNTQIISYKQNKLQDSNFEAQENQERLSEVGNGIIMNNLRRYQYTIFRYI